MNIAAIVDELSRGYFEKELASPDSQGMAEASSEPMPYWSASILGHSHRLKITARGPATRKASTRFFSSSKTSI